VKIALQFLGMGLVWGASFLFMKVALTGVSFGQVAWSRTVLGALTLGIVVVVMRERLPRDPVVWGHLAVLAVFNCVLPYLLFAWAEQYVSSGLASIYNATTPIMTAIIVTLGFRVEKLGREQVLGILIGILGVFVIIGLWNYDSITGSLRGQLACLGATACYGVAFGYIRKYLLHRDITGTTLAFTSIGVSAVVFLLLTPLVAWHPVRLDIWVVGSLVLLGALGTGLAYVWSFNVQRAWGPTSTSTVTYLTPVVGVVLGIVILGERLSWNEPLGALLVILGILLAQNRIRFRRAAAPAP
jgi:drug/metabolite transporter (DMT)-like permease